MTTAWFVYVLVVGALLALGASALASALRAVGRPTRGVYALALAGTIALAAIAPRQSPLQMSLAPSTVVASAPLVTAPGAITLADRARFARARVDWAAVTLIAALDRSVSPVTPRMAVAAWATASALLLTLFVLVNRRMLVARRRWPSREMHGVAVRVAPHAGPAVLGLLRAEIVVPRSLLDRPTDEQQLVVAHEREHLRARDHLLLGGAWLGAIAFPWHPGVWYLVNRIRLAIELDCDARILRGGASPQSYGALLIDMAAHRRPTQVGALALADGPSHLERRILAMKVGKGRHMMARGVALAAIGGLLALAACEARVPTSAELHQLDVGSFEKKAQEFALVDDRMKQAEYILNGAPASAADAHAIEAKMIGSVEVVKSELPTGRDTIFVTTVDRMPKQNETPVALRRAASMVPDSPRDSSWDRELAREGILSSGEAVLIMIDGKRSSQRELAALKPADIVEVSIQKTGAPVTSSEGKAADGYISIVTRKAKSASRP